MAIDSAPKVVGTAGPFTIRMNCFASPFNGGVNYVMYLTATFPGSTTYKKSSYIPAGITENASGSLMSASTQGRDGEPFQPGEYSGQGDAEVWALSGEVLRIYGHLTLDKTSCAVSDAKAYVSTS